MTHERIQSRKNPLIHQVRQLLTSRRAREEAGLYVADGIKLLDEAVRHGAPLHTVLLSDDVQAEVPQGVRVVRVPPDVMQSVSPMATPQGALFLCALPEREAFVPHAPMLLLDGIQDPGNLGTILRTADALRVPVALLEGCADPYSHKVVRASMGAVFRTRAVQTSWDEAAAALHAHGISVAATALSPHALDIRAAQLARMAVVIGSEGQGVRPQIVAQAEQTLIIPMNPACESLNAAVAASIVAWQMQQV